MTESNCGIAAKMSLIKNIPRTLRMMLNKVLVVMFWLSVYNCAQRKGLAAVLEFMIVSLATEA
jgi:hypothetical protein